MKTTLTFLSGLVLGILFTCLAQRAPDDSGESTGEPTSTPRQARSSPTTLHHPSAKKNYSKTVRSTYQTSKDQYNSFASQNMLEDLSQEDLKSFILLSIENADPINGLDWKGQLPINQALKRLATLDFDGTFAWLDRSLLPATRDYCYQEILKEHFLKQPIEGIYFSKEKNLSAEIIDSLAGKYMNHPQKTMDTSTAIFLLENLKTGSRSSGSEIKFTDDFNFLTFATQALKKTEDADGSSISSFPSNLYKEWAKRNPEEAIAFYDEHLVETDLKLPFNDIGSILEGYLGSVSEDQAQEWISKTLTPDNLPVKEQATIIATIMTKDIISRDQLVSTLQNLKMSNDEIFNLYASRYSGWGQSYTNTRLTALRTFPDAQSRLDTLLQSSKKLSEEPEHVKELTSQLLKLGHSEADIDRLKTAIDNQSESSHQ